MRIVNISSKVVHTKYAGFLRPGQSCEGNRQSRKLAEVLEEVVSSCGDNFGISLSQRELQLINRVMELDEKGVGFDPSSLPEEVAKDPTGEKRSAEKARAAQQAELDSIKKKNAQAAMHEAVINGEIEERKPVGLATMEGEPVDPGEIKSGFEKLMEENRMISDGSAAKIDPNEMLDPIGSHMKGVAAAPVGEDAAKEPPKVKKASGVDGDGTKSADVEEPLPTVSERAGAMDRQAADIAGKLANIGPVDEPAPKAAKTQKRGSGKKSSK